MQYERKMMAGGPRPMSAGGTCGIFLVLLGLFWAMPLLFAFVYHEWASFVIASLALCLLGSLAPLLVLGHGIVSAGSFAGVLVATLLGLHAYYAHIGPLHALGEMPSYNNVYPQDSASAYRDAALIRFAPGTIVDDQKSVAMFDIDGGAAVYCVAPISDARSVGHAEFWAVGIDCCGPKRFTCGDAGDFTVRGGPVLQRPPQENTFFHLIGRHAAPSLARFDLWEKAVDKAKGTHGIASAAKPIFVQWDASSRDDLIASHWEQATVFLAIQLVLALALALGLTRLAARGSLNEAARLLPKAAEDLYGGRARPLKLVLQDILLLVFAVPYIAIVGCTFIMSYRPCLESFASPAAFGEGQLWFGSLMDLFLLCLAAMILKLMLTPQRQLYGGFLLLTSAIGLYCGYVNYSENMAFYCAAESGREYTNVHADASATGYQDAGKMHFAEHTMVHTGWSLGFLAHGQTFCAAPVIDGSNTTATATDVPRVDFWAVGVDCCGARGVFTCDSAEDAAARGGLVIHGRETATVTEAMSRRAVKAAAEYYGLPVPERAVLLRWASDEKFETIQEEWKKSALGITILSATVPLVGLAVVSLACLVTAWAFPST